MDGKCLHHPGRDATTEIGGKKYCAKCEDAQSKAAKRVSMHVEPKDCFVWYLGGDKWAPIMGTGCAHWVAHQKGIKHGLPIHRCLQGFTLKVADIAKGKREIKTMEQVRAGDIYINHGKTHCGIVCRVQKIPGRQLKIEIQHDSSSQGRVAKNDFQTYFGGRGSFFR